MKTSRVKEIIAKDRDGVKRCYGLGTEYVEALENCRKACYEYLMSRPDIEVLYLYYGGGYERPVIDAAKYETMTVRIGEE